MKEQKESLAVPMWWPRGLVIVSWHKKDLQVDEDSSIPSDMITKAVHGTTINEAIQS
jgi:hypothetical protein